MLQTYVNSGHAGWWKCFKYLASNGLDCRGWSFILAPEEYSWYMYLGKFKYLLDYHQLKQRNFDNYIDEEKYLRCNLSYSVDILRKYNLLTVDTVKDLIRCTLCYNYDDYHTKIKYGDEIIISLVHEYKIEWSEFKDKLPTMTSKKIARLVIDNTPIDDLLEINDVYWKSLDILDMHLQKCGRVPQKMLDLFNDLTVTKFIILKHAENPIELLSHINKADPQDPNNRKLQLVGIKYGFIPDDLSAAEAKFLSGGTHAAVNAIRNKFGPSAYPITSDMVTHLDITGLPHNVKSMIYLY